MKKTTKFWIICLVNSVASLLLGAVIYLVFRSDTYIHKIIDVPLNFITSESDLILLNFLRFYFADALWAYSLTFALAIFSNEYFAPLCATFCGILWELSQKLGITKGTFDYADIAMYFFASSVAGIIIYLIKRRENL